MLKASLFFGQIRPGENDNHFHSYFETKIRQKKIGSF